MNLPKDIIESPLFDSPVAMHELPSGHHELNLPDFTPGYRLDPSVAHELETDEVWVFPRGSGLTLFDSNSLKEQGFIQEVAEKKSDLDGKSAHFVLPEKDTEVAHRAPDHAPRHGAQKKMQGVWRSYLAKNWQGAKREKKRRIGGGEQSAG